MGADRHRDSLRRNLLRARDLDAEHAEFSNVAVMSCARTSARRGRSDGTPIVERRSRRTVGGVPAGRLGTARLRLARRWQHAVCSIEADLRRRRGETPAPTPPAKQSAASRLTDVDGKNCNTRQRVTRRAIRMRRGWKVASRICIVQIEDVVPRIPTQSYCPLQRFLVRDVLLLPALCRDESVFTHATFALR